MRDNVKGGALTEVSFFVLLATWEPRHGYGIMQFIESETNGRLRLGAGTLYGAIASLEKKGWIAQVESAQDKKLYQITKEGEKVAEAEKERLRSVIASAERIMEGLCVNTDTFGE
ncbi:MAG: PadR family transcriptional regulator [Clostridia bacterium]|nr:helix-turn-helix transcriptional regulator [Lachnospiraceae bacterium]NCC01454.1 PadR family transcriptional regulator [Clostridia bacterium]NCD02118.1 PadR family transcriptional regulator [Clostridia bacterium]